MTPHACRIAIRAVVAALVITSCGGGGSDQTDDVDGDSVGASQATTLTPVDPAPVGSAAVETATTVVDVDAGADRPPATDPTPSDSTPPDPVATDAPSVSVPPSSSRPDTDFSTIGECADLVDGEYFALPCGQPHDAQFAGAADIPVDVLPDDADDARTLLVSVCGPLVADLVERPVESPAVAVGFRADTGLGEAGERVDCFFQPGDDLLVGSIVDVGLAGALGSVLVASDLAPGECFEFLDGDTFWFVLPAECSQPGALVAVGSFVAGGPDVWPGEDALRAQRTERCVDVLDASGVDADPATLSGTFPGRSSWEANGRRLVTCDATPL